MAREPNLGNNMKIRQYLETLLAALAINILINWRSASPLRPTARAPENVIANSWVRKRFTMAEIEHLSKKLPPLAYYTKRANLDLSIRNFKATAGEISAPLASRNFGKRELGPINFFEDFFPSRVFSLLDMLDWNKTHGFLSCDRALFLFDNDVEQELVRSRNPIDFYVFNSSDNTADLHFPITASHVGKYDLVIFSQTLEHLYDPVLCLKNLFDAMRPGGYLFTTVPLLNHLHFMPHFFSMPTSMGLIVWPSTAGFEVKEVGLFGNPQYIANLGGKPKTWAKLSAYYNKTRNPQVLNDPLTPAQGWLLAQKPHE